MIDLSGRDQSWWSDLSGRTVAILASGPSMTREQCDVVRQAGWYAVAINETWRLARWAPVLYGCDWQWWKSRAPRGVDYDGLRVIGFLPKRNGKPFLPPDMKWQADRLRHAPIKVGPKMIWEGREIGTGSNSAFQAANLVIRWGASRVVLLGVDCHSANKHWHDAHGFVDAIPQKPSLMATWIRAWENAAKDLKRRGVEVVNCSPGTALDAFPKMTLDQAVRQWGQVYA